MKTKLTDAQKIERIAQKHEADGWNFYARYSGRCMFGDCCPGIVCPSWDVKDVQSAVRRAGIKASPSLDNMGLDMIVYWSSIESDPETETVILTADLEDIMASEAIAREICKLGPC